MLSSEKFVAKVASLVYERENCDGADKIMGASGHQRQQPV